MDHKLISFGITIKNDKEYGQNS